MVLSSEKREDPAVPRDKRPTSMEVAVNNHSKASRTSSGECVTGPLRNVRATSTDLEPLRPLILTEDALETTPGETTNPFYGHDGEDTATDSV